MKIITTSGSAVSTSSQRVWTCSITGSKHRKRSTVSKVGKRSPWLGAKLTNSHPDSTEKKIRQIAKLEKIFFREIAN